METELIYRTFARISASSDGPNWLGDGSHRPLRQALEKVTDEDARKVLTELVGMVGVLDRRLSNIYAATVTFRDYLDNAFSEMLDAQVATEQPTDRVEKAAAVLRLAEALTTMVDGGVTSLDDQPGSGSAAGAAFAKVLSEPAQPR